MSNSSWSPDEDAATIYAEDTWFQGALLFCTAYGAIATLSIQCFAMLVKGLRRTTLRRDVTLLVFVALIFSVNTVFAGVAMQFTMQAFVNDRDFPGGPNAYEIEEFSIPIDSVANICLIVSTFLADALLLWRCTVIYRSSFDTDIVSTIIAIAFWITEVVIGSLFLAQLYVTTPWGTVNLTLGFWCLSLAVNVLATSLIVGRLLFYRKRLYELLGPSHGAQYTGIIAMVVESELLYTTYLVIFITLFVLNNPLVNVFMQGISSVQVVASLMIVYRVAQGKGWSKETHTFISTPSTTGNLNSVHLSDISTVRAGGSSQFTEDGIKSIETTVQVVREVYTRKDSMTAEDSV